MLPHVFLRQLLVLGTMLTAPLLPAYAFSVTEVGDAGETLTTAQVLSGTGPLETISGALSSNNADLFQIFIDGGNFSATTLPNNAFNTQLFLFDALGRGVVANDDSSIQTTGSTLNAIGLSSGIYYLAISGFDYDPTSVNGFIFPNNARGQRTPQTNSPLTGFGQRTTLESDSGFYTLTLSGASGVPVPGPGPALGLLALGGLGGLKQLYRNRARSQQH
ncbi:DVUA0089 family protein [Anthocerotibacter panamensis]|uniref:DVUA0089 family protein n=1 Tax=Anthocerotibacter panamensis TaxID=2857077 RepID=UPI001C40584F|nr:DVUA0089 family protein [Anthocerotibacter panamensis]